MNLLLTFTSDQGYLEYRALERHQNFPFTSDSSMDEFCTVRFNLPAEYEAEILERGLTSELNTRRFQHSYYFELED
jgi:hypothetical protein